MTNRIEILKGIHPGKIIERDLEKKHLTQRALAQTVGVPYQTINAIISGRRNITVELSLNIEKTLNYDEGFLLILQVYHNIALYKEQKSKEKYGKSPNIKKSLFWDTDFDKIDWERYKKAVINRVWERGSKEEKEEIAHFYGIEYNDLPSYISSANHPIFSKRNL